MNARAHRPATLVLLTVLMTAAGGLSGACLSRQAAAVSALEPRPEASADANSAPRMPAYDTEGKLLLADDYQRWVFLGSSLGLGYSDRTPSHKMFHHTYMEPGAFEHFAETGEFRQGTMLVLALYGVGEGVLPSRHGQFSAELRAIEMAVKDHERFEEGWAYYDFGGTPSLSAAAFAKESCHDCHAEHAARDNVFMQYYPILQAAAP